MYTAQDLATEFAFEVSTIHWLVAKGVVPHARPTSAGRRYGKDAYDALVAYRRAIPSRGDRVTIACLAERRHAGNPGPPSP